MPAETSTQVAIWWTTLGAIGVVNICAWLVVAAPQLRGRASTPSIPSTPSTPSSPPPPPGGRWQVLLSALFVAGCAFRSFLPRAEGQRICLYDSWISSALWGRSVATVAELALIAQWTLLLRDYAAATRTRPAAVAARLLLPLIATAELFSWYTTLTTNFIGSVIEESLWAVTSMLLISGLLLSWRRLGRRVQRFVGAVVALNLAYVVFMWTVDVPMYASRWTADQARGKTYLTLDRAFGDAQRRRIVTRRWIDWHQEVPWMSLYFSAGVWISIALTRAPRPPRSPRDGSS